MGEMPDSYQLVVNENHPLVERILEDKNKSVGEQVDSVRGKIESLNGKRQELEKS